MSDIRKYITLIENARQQNSHLFEKVVILGGSIPNELKTIINDFLEENYEDVEYSKKRDNCGVVASNFQFFAEKRGVNVKRVEGNFKIEKYIPNKKDLTKKELMDMKDKGYEIPKDIMAYAKEQGFMEELYFIPHYWNNYNGIIIDFSAYYQFKETGMVNHITKENYKH